MPTIWSGKPTRAKRSARARAGGAGYAGGVARPDRPPPFLRRWEALSPGAQAAVVFPPLAAVLFLLNLGGFGQPLWRSILYGLIEALPFTALVLVATANERRRRSR